MFTKKNPHNIGKRLKKLIGVIQHDPLLTNNQKV